MNDLDHIISLAAKFFDIAVVAFVFLIELFIAALIVIYISDKFQTKHTIRRNYPVIGRFRYYFEHLGEFFRMIDLYPIAQLRPELIKVHEH